MRMAAEVVAALLMVTGLGSADSQTPRGLFINKAADAMRVRVVDEKTDSAVFPDQQFKQGDTLRIEITTNFDAHLYIVNLEIANDKTNRFLVFPSPAVPDNQLKADSSARLSSTFDQHPATEVLQVIASHDSLDFLESALKSSNCSESENRCPLDQVAGARLTQLLGNRRPSSGQKGGVFSVSGEKRKDDSIRTRDIILSAGKDKEDKNTYVAVQKDGGAEGRLKSGEILAFEIRLKHL